MEKTPVGGGDCFKTLEPFSPLQAALGPRWSLYFKALVVARGLGQSTLFVPACSCPFLPFALLAVSDLALTARLVTVHGPLAGLGELLVKGKLRLGPGPSHLFLLLLCRAVS